jgi:selenocysteine-specific elongation factor
MEKTLAQFHREKPLLPGMPREELRTRCKIPAHLFDAVLQRNKKIVAQGEFTRLAVHRVQLQQDEEEARARIENAFRAGGLAVPGQREVLASCGVDGTRAAILLNTMLREKKLVRVSMELVFHASAIEALCALLAAKKGQRFNVGEFKDWTGASRKYAIPLLEFLDRERVTRRDGDDRVVL